MTVKLTERLVLAESQLTQILSSRPDWLLRGHYSDKLVLPCIVAALSPLTRSDFFAMSQ